MTIDTLQNKVDHSGGVFMCFCSPAHHSSLDSVQTGATALYIAAQNGHLRVVELLIAAMARVDVQTEVRFNCSYDRIIMMHICTMTWCTGDLS